MKIKSAVFIKGVVGPDSILEADIPQIVFIGRSNVGKSSVINSLTNQKNLAKTSSFPGRTQQINIFLINEAIYLIDLPGYGFAKLPKEVRCEIQSMVSWYLFDSDYFFKKAVLIIDAKIGPTNSDMQMLRNLEKGRKEIIIVANKVDKIKKSEFSEQAQKIKGIFSLHRVILYSAKDNMGVVELVGELLR